MRLLSLFPPDTEKTDGMTLALGFPHSKLPGRVVACVSQVQLLLNN